MKKLLLIVCLVVCSIGAKAQFEQGKWIINPSLTGFELSHSEKDDMTLGLEVKAGTFLMDNVALLVDMGAKWAKGPDVFNLGVSGRYYFDQIGIYTGAGLGLNHWKSGGWNHTDYSLNLEVGYAFFITKTVTIEPAAFCNVSFKDFDYTKYGLKVGFGFYF